MGLFTAISLLRPRFVKKYNCNISDERSLSLLPVMKFDPTPLISGAPNDRFVSNAFKRCFRLSGILLKLCRLILGCAKLFLPVRIF